MEGSSSGDGFVVGWYERRADRTHLARLGLWARAGDARWTQTISERGRNTVARVAGDLVFAAWIEDEADPGAGVWSGWWNLRGDMVVAPRRIADAGKTTYNLNAALEAHPDLQGFRRWILATHDAHGLYAQNGYTPLERPQNWMERRPRRGYD